MSIRVLNPDRGLFVHATSRDRRRARRGRCGCGSKFVDDERDAAGEEIVGRFLADGFEEFGGDVGLVCAEEEAAGEEIDVADAEALVVAHGVEVRERGGGAAVGSEGVVMAVEDENGLGQQERLHTEDVKGGEAHGDEALPLSSGRGAARTERAKGFGGKLEHALDAGGADVGFEEGDGVADERNLSDFADLFAEQGTAASTGRREEVGDDELLGAKELVQRSERELATTVEEI